MFSEHLRESLRIGLDLLGLESDKAFYERLWNYLGLLRKWDRYARLTGFSDSDKAFVEHVLDCATLYSLVSGFSTVYSFPAEAQGGALRPPPQNESLDIVSRRAPSPSAISAEVQGDALRPPVGLDVGTGGGFPGLILALLSLYKSFPTSSSIPSTIPCGFWVLLDSNARKCHFLTQTVIELGLPNVEVVCSRVEDVSISMFSAVPSVVSGKGFTHIVARALSSAYELYKCVHHLGMEGGSIWTLKGVGYQSELGELDGAGLNYRVVELLSNRYAIEIRL